MKELTILALVVALASPTFALSQKDKKHEKGKGKDKAADVQVTVTFGDDDRQAASAYFAKKYGKGNCPPGLAKKNNGCLPPGQAKKRYQVGQPLPREVVYVEPPHELVVSLRPCPSGYKYVVVDGDLVKLAIGTMLVVDAIDGLIH
jgi:Ni/Co efflux regulator RcnB